MTHPRALDHPTRWAPVRHELAASDGRPPVLRRARDRLASAGIRRPRLTRGRRTETPFDAPSIRTARLLLRPHRMSDAVDWFDLQSQPEVREFLPWPERDARSSARHLRDRTRHTRLWQANDFLALAVEKDGRLIGDVSLHLRTVEAPSRSVEIGWVLHPAAGGHGYATEATEALLGFAYDVVCARWVTAVTHARNHASLALARRLGFVDVRSEGHDIVLMRPAGVEVAPRASTVLSH
ncbi:GNAT family N-acetyltransferase [Herbiconiux sp. CPCC 205763]|uniref:GNAT family N-acetyltransferase n=1 Tax=Herbiconiux aconitum TaxID=2970913 RepID=A0ABT2GP71_9MICO|nr:GNAT family N-acetyltransferase [Herbiconiux aconitum]MCS5717968.1 GNAT family N-acetyltransferase [Herbiconiux aconitum]